MVVHHGLTTPYVTKQKQLTPFQNSLAPNTVCVPLLPSGPDGVYK